MKTLSRFSDLYFQTFERFAICFFLLGIGFGLGKGSMFTDDDASVILIVSLMILFMSVFVDMLIHLLKQMENKLDAKNIKKQTESIS